MGGRSSVLAQREHHLFQSGANPLAGGHFFESLSKQVAKHHQVGIGAGLLGGGAGGGFGGGGAGAGLFSGIGGAGGGGSESSEEGGAGAAAAGGLGAFGQDW